MKKHTIGLLLALIFIFTACSNDISIGGNTDDQHSNFSEENFTGDEPPSAFLVIGEERIELTQGGFNWNGRIVDIVSPIDLLRNEGVEPIVVQPEEEIRFEVDYDLQPNEENLIRLRENSEWDVLFLEDNSFVVPATPGEIFYYTYDIFWTDSEDPQISVASASYVFSLRIAEN